MAKTDFDVGDVLDGRYQLLRDIGRGAAGKVFEARHLFTGRFVAVKVVRLGGAASTTELRSRLQREGQALAAIQHPGVVNILDGGITPDGSPYIVMEMLEGRTLEGLLVSRGRIPTSDTVGVALQLCDALDAAHAAGVVHRDVKPSNVIVMRTKAGQEQVKLVDFGIARVETLEEQKLTGPGAVIGTPAYMSPEQLMGLGDVDGRTDVYSLGTLMFECLCGEMPYVGNYAQVLLRAATDEPPPSLRSFTGKLDIPRALSDIVDRSIAKARDTRYASVSELRKAILTFVPGAGYATSLLGPPPAAANAPEAQSAAVQRRKVARAPYNTPVHLVLKGGGLDGRTEDISEGGLLVIARATCEARQRVGVRFALPMEGRVVSLEADVRWVRLANPAIPDGMRAIGLEFVDAPPALVASVQRYVALMTRAQEPQG